MPAEVVTTIVGPSSPAPATSAEPSSVVAPADSAPPPADAGDGTTEADSAPEAEAKDPKAAKADKDEALPSEKESAYGRVLRKREQKLIRREQENGTRHATLTAREAELQNTHAGIETRAKALAAEEALASEDPIAWLAKRGIREEDIARRVLGGGKPHEEELRYKAAQQQSAKEKALEDKLEALARKLEENVEKPRQAEAQKAAAAKLRTDYAAFTETQAATFPHVARAMKGDPEETFAAVDAIASRVLAETGGKDSAEFQRRFPRGAGLWEEVTRRHNAYLARISGAVSAPPAAEADTKGPVKLGQKGQAANDDNAPTLSGKGSSARATIADDEVVDLDEDPKVARKKAIGRIRAMTGRGNAA